MFICEQRESLHKRIILFVCCKYKNKKEEVVHFQFSPRFSGPMGEAIKSSSVKLTVQWV